MAAKPQIQVAFCFEWGYESEAVRVTAEILSRLAPDVAVVHLVPVTGGRFEIDVDGTRVFDNQKTGRFPETGEALRLVEARLAQA